MTVALMTGLSVERASWPHYFPGSGARLFGCYHHVSPGVVARGGMALCSPWGHEYMACYRTMRQTAVRLAQAGWGSLRFDFFGCGDSEGATPEGRPERWVRDIGSAADDIRARLPRAPMSFLGIRLGATLALQYSLSADAAECDALVLWDPIVKGRDYVAELTSLQRERFGTSAEDEALGMPLGPALRAELERIDLLGAECPNAGRVLIVETGAPSTHVSDLAERLRAAGSNVSRRRFETAAVWSDTQKAAVPNAVIQAVVNWMRGQ